MRDQAELAHARNLIALSRYAPARELLAKVVAGDPHDVQALCLLAQTYLGLKDDEAASRAARAACQAGPNEEWAFRLLALAAARQRQALAAHEAAEHAIRLEPNNWRTYLVRAQIDLIIEAVTPATEAAARQAVRLAPDQVETQRVLGAVLMAEKRTDEAESALRAALRLDPQDAAARNDLAQVHLRRRNLGRAAAGFAEAASLNPRDQAAAHNLVVVGARALRMVHWILWIVLFTAGRMASYRGSGGRAAVVVGFAVASVALLAFGVTIWRGARPRTLRLSRIILRRDRLLAGWSICLVVAYVCLGAAMVVPGPAITKVLGGSFASVFVGVVLSWVRSRRSR